MKVFKFRVIYVSISLMFLFSSCASRMNIGVVGFSDKVKMFPAVGTVVPLTQKNKDKFRIFVSTLEQGQLTSYYYAMHKAIQRLNKLKHYDKLFLVSFTDGLDNNSSVRFMKAFGKDKRDYSDKEAREATIKELKRSKITAFAVGLLGNDAAGDESIETVLKDFDTYKSPSMAHNSRDLGKIFSRIANNLLASSVSLNYSTSASKVNSSDPKIMRFNFKAVNLKDNTEKTFVLYGKYTNTDRRHPRFEVIRSEGSKAESINEVKPVAKTEESTNTTAPTTVAEGEALAVATEVTDPEIHIASVIDGKIKKGRAIIPLEDLSIDNYLIKIDETTTEVKHSGSWAFESEGSKTSSEAFKKVAVFLVLDNSASLGDEGLSIVKEDADSFIETIYNK